MKDGPAMTVPRVGRRGTGKDILFPLIFSRSIFDPDHQDAPGFVVDVAEFGAVLIVQQNPPSRCSLSASIAALRVSSIWRTTPSIRFRSFFGMVPMMNCCMKIRSD